MFSEQELLAFEIDLRHPGPASHLWSPQEKGVGLCRKTACGGGRHSYFGESYMYTCFLGYQGESTPAYAQGFLVYFSPSYAQMKMNDSHFSFLPELMDETHRMLSKGSQTQRVHSVYFHSCKV